MTKEKDGAINSQDYEAAAKLREDEAALREKVDTLRGEWQTTIAGDAPTVDEEEIAQVVAMWTGIPVTRISEAETERLLHMEDSLHQRVVGQQEAIEIVAKAVRRARAGLKDPKRPIGSFVFLGPTGVGKTELARALAEFMFGSEDTLIKIDMSEFMERHNVSRLVGAPPGYVGFDEGGQLTEAVRRKSYAVVLLDEVEKAHPEVFNILLQILEDGQLTDAKGRRVDFRNTIIIMTSNLGAKQLQTNSSLGFRPVADDEPGRQEQSYELMKEKVSAELKNSFRPEFLNRIDATVVFRSLTVEEIRDDRRHPAPARPRPAQGPEHEPRGHAGRQGPAHQARLGSGIRRPAAASGRSRTTSRTSSPSTCSSAATSRARRSRSTPTPTTAWSSGPWSRRPPSKSRRPGHGPGPDPLRLPGLRRRLPSLGGPVPLVRGLEHARRDGRDCARRSARRASAARPRSERLRSPCPSRRPPTRRRPACRRACASWIASWAAASCPARSCSSVVSPGVGKSTLLLQVAGGVAGAPDSGRCPVRDRRGVRVPGPPARGAPRARRRASGGRHRGARDERGRGDRRGRAGAGGPRSSSSTRSRR